MKFSTSWVLPLLLWTGTAAVATKCKVSNDTSLSATPSSSLLSSSSSFYLYSSSSSSSVSTSSNPAETSAASFCAHNLAQQGDFGLTNPDPPPSTVWIDASGADASTEITICPFDGFYACMQFNVTNDGSANPSVNRAATTQVVNLPYAGMYHITFFIYNPQNGTDTITDHTITLGVDIEGVPGQVTEWGLWDQPAAYDDLLFFADVTVPVAGPYTFVIYLQGPTADDDTTGTLPFLLAYVSSVEITCEEVDGT